MNLKLLFFFVFLSFSIFSQSHQIIITEIFADPTPSKGLPENEFLEIYNTTSEDINLKNFKLFYGLFFVVFPEYKIKSNEYAIICRKGFEETFKPYGSVIPVPSLSLNNEGALLVLKNPLGQDVTYADYHISWHSLDNTGGISLELIDINFPCTRKQNWASSVQRIGGTPGKANSVSRVNPDLSSPKLLNYSLNENELVLNFDEDLSVEFLKYKTNFKVKEGLVEVSNLVFKPYKTSTVTLHLSQSIELGQNIELIILNLEDCSGNRLDSLAINVGNLIPAQIGEVLLSEILFNPKSGGEDFVELYNSSNNTLNLNGWKFAKLDSKNELSEISDIVNYDLLIKPKSFLAFSKNKNYLHQNYPQTGQVVEVLKMSAFNNDAGTVIVLNKNDLEFDRFNYSDKMHNELIVNSEGISLERANFSIPKSLWTSAAEDFGFATPGSRNSQSQSESLSNVFFVEPIIFNPYQNSLSTTTFLKYNLNGQGFAVTIDVMDKNGKLVRHLINNRVLGSAGQLEWDGRNNSGELLAVGYYLFKISLYSSKVNQDFVLKCVIGSN